MNCQPGDLAVIVRLEAAYEGATSFGVVDLRGTIVRCVELLDGGNWRIDLRQVKFRCSQGNVTADLDSVSDAILRPIRDPGDDATDETLTWLPVPSRETA